MFDWYLEEIPFRLKQLQEYLDENVRGKIQLTKEPETIKLLWAWFIDTIKTRKRTKTELEDDLRNAPEYLRKQIEQDDLNPRLIVNNCMLHCLKNKAPNKLWDCYNFWISEKT